MSVYKISYFNAKAKGELSRLLLSAAGKEFEDERFNDETWPIHKAKMPLGQVPVLTVDGQQIPQSGAIQRYLAREFGLFGKNNMENTECDVILETIEQEVQTEMTKYYYAGVGNEQEKKAEIKRNLMENVYPKFLQFMDKILKKNGTGYLVGSELTVADLAYFNVQDKLKSETGEECPAINDYPELLKLIETVKSVPNIRRWLEKRPETA